MVEFERVLARWLENLENEQDDMLDENEPEWD